MPQHHWIRVSVVVLGDVGRSPRMQYHALSLASGPADVDVVGYPGSTPHRKVREQAGIRWHYLRPLWFFRPKRLPRLLFLGNSLLKVLSECLQLAWLLLFATRKPDVVLVQNPPAIPTLLVTLIVARVRSARLVVDWHNFGYSVLSLRLGSRHPVVRLARWYERFMGRCADAHLCVSRAMQADLRESWGIPGAIVHYDRPVDFFARTPPDVRQDLFHRLREAIAFPAVMSRPEVAKRPAILISPTSWTADEDFSVLIDAVRQCEEMIRIREHAASHRPFPHLLILITGKGPQREHYEKQITRLAARKVHLRTLWLSAEDYPLLLGASDLGICLHRSSSGLDLPMKIADMFGSGLPVCALDYGPCLKERVRHGENGLLFSNSAQLAEQLYSLFEGFPDHTPLLTRLRQNVATLHRQRWSGGWMETVRPLFDGLKPASGS